MFMHKIVLFFLIATSIISFASNVEGSLTTIVDSNNAGTHNSIAIDSSNHVHISYGMNGGFHFNNVDALKYATNLSGSWEITTIDSNGYVGGYTSIAIDSSGKVHISYYDYTNLDLKYATNASGNWVITIVDSDGDVGKYSSIAIDLLDKIHISYYDSTNYDLKYATNASGNWVKESIESSDLHSFTSIALDSKNNVSISYVSSNDLRYATNATGDWVSTIIDNDISDTSNSGMYTSIAIDSADNVHISYMHKSRGSLKYATNTSGGWVITEVETVNGIIGEFSSIALDSKDKVHISYSDYTNGRTKYATNSSGSWVMITIENYTTASNPFGYTSISTDSIDNVHISYVEHGFTYQHLKYAVYMPALYDATGTWEYSESNNWASSGCKPDDDETGTLTLTQTGNSVILSLPDETINGSVSSENYYFSTSFYDEGRTTYYINIKLSSNTSGSGEITWTQDNGCEGGKNIILTRLDSGPSGGGGGNLVTSDLWIRAVIETVEKGPIEAVWQKGGEDTTARGDTVIWGHFYASPSDVTWGSQNNPDLFVKIWIDISGRIDVNYFHVSVPDIEVYSDYPYDGTADEQGTTTMERRYIRQYYENGQSHSEDNYEDGVPAAGYSQTGNPSGYSTINDLRIGSMINTVEKGPIDAAWRLGGQDTTDRGDQVVWGHFYARPSDVTWGIQDNPDLFVKIWFDVSGRVDVNFFHVSVPDIEVYSDLPDDSSYDQKGTTIMDDRYIRHEY